MQGAAAKAPAKKLVAGKDIKAQQFKVGGQIISLGFTKSNELFVSRAAMIGVATSIIGEVSAAPSTMLDTCQYPLPFPCTAIQEFSIPMQCADLLGQCF